MAQDDPINASLERLGGFRFNTAFQPERQREEWLREVIGREYANVEITPPKSLPLYNDMLIYPMHDGIRFSPINSNPVELERLPKEPTDISHDCYFAVVLLSGNYKLEQGGREVFLRPGEMSIYDATEPHKITIPEPFSKLIISIPRKLIDLRLQGLHRLTASKLSSHEHMSLAASMLTNFAKRFLEFEQTSFQVLSEPILEMVQASLIDNGATQRTITNYKAMSLLRVKNYIHTHLDDENLNAQQIAKHVRLSVRYINELFQSEHSSVMRFVTERRLERSRQYLASDFFSQLPITDIALRCGFKNCSHFSRVFKDSFEYSPRLYRQLNKRGQSPFILKK